MVIWKSLDWCWRFSLSLFVCVYPFAEGICNMTMDSNSITMPMSDPNAWATAMNNLGMPPMGITGQPLMPGTRFLHIRTNLVLKMWLCSMKYEYGRSCPHITQLNCISLILHMLETSFCCLQFPDIGDPTPSMFCFCWIELLHLLQLHFWHNYLISSHLKWWFMLKCSLQKCSSSC